MCGWERGKREHAYLIGGKYVYAARGQRDADCKASESGDQEARAGMSGLVGTCGGE